MLHCPNVFYVTKKYIKPPLIKNYKTKKDGNIPILLLLSYFIMALGQIPCHLQQGIDYNFGGNPPLLTALHTWYLCLQAGLLTMLFCQHHADTCKTQPLQAIPVPRKKLPLPPFFPQCGFLHQYLLESRKALLPLR